jgi:replicative DNA helicase
MSDPKSMLNKFDDLLQLVENGKHVPFSNLVMINHEEMSNMILQLKENFPEEIRKCSLLLQEKESFMERTREEAKRIIQKAEDEKNEKVKEETIYKEAERAVFEMKDRTKQQMMEMLAGVSQAIIELDKELRDKLNEVYSGIKEVYKPIDQTIKSIQTDWIEKV